MEFTTDETFEGPRRMYGTGRNVGVGVKGFGVGRERKKGGEGERRGLKSEKIEKDKRPGGGLVLKTKVRMKSVDDRAKNSKSGGIKSREKIVDKEKSRRKIRM